MELCYNLEEADIFLQTIHMLFHFRFKRFHVMSPPNGRKQRSQQRVARTPVLRRESSVLYVEGGLGIHNMLAFQVE